MIGNILFRRLLLLLFPCLEFWETADFLTKSAIKKPFVPLIGPDLRHFSPVYACKERLYVMLALKMVL